MSSSSFVRTAGVWCIAGAVIAAVGAILSAVLPSSVPSTQLSAPYTPAVFVVTEMVWTISHMLMFWGTLGLARSGAAGHSRLGGIGLSIALLGMALVALSELGYAFFPNATNDAPAVLLLDTVIGIATMLAGLGFVVAGAAVLRAGRWHGWQRWTPLLCGLFVFVALIPTLVLWPELFLWPVAGWSACFVPLGLALYRQRALSLATTSAAVV